MLRDSVEADRAVEAPRERRALRETFMDIALEPMVFLAMGTLGVILFGLTLTPLLSDREVWTIRLRILALCLLAVGMVTFGVSFALAG